MSDFFKGITFANQNVTPVDDAILRRRLLTDGILTGCALTYAGYTLTMASGYLIACGRQIRRPTAENWAISDATSGYARVLMTIDLTRTATEEVFDQVNTSIEYATAEDGFPALIQDDINATGSKYQVVLAIVSLGTGGITGIASCLAPARSYGSNYNLLDNSDFRNPVNQRGSVSYTGKPVYTIDRWKIYDGTLAVSSDGYVSYTGQFYQYIDGVDFDKPYTFAVGLKDGIVCVSGKFSDQPTASLGNTKITMVASNDYGEVVLEPANGSTVGGAFWAALYEGEYTAETLPDYQPKGYGAELLECQRYFQWLKIGGEVNGRYIGYRIPLSPVMRTNPSTTGFNLTATSGQATITAGGYLAESDCFRMDAYIGSDADKWWTCDVALSADL